MGLRRGDPADVIGEVMKNWIPLVVGPLVGGLVFAAIGQWLAARGGT